MRTGKQNAGLRKDKVTGELLPKPVDENGNELPCPFYNTYICVGVLGKTGFHVAMRDSHLDAVVTELVLARLERPDFLAMLGEHGAFPLAMAGVAEVIRVRGRRQRVELWPSVSIRLRSRVKDSPGSGYVRAGCRVTGRSSAR